MTTTIYQKRSSIPVVSCGLMLGSYSALFDEASWETFDEPKLEEYVRKGTRAFQERIQKITDPSYTLTEEETKELFFMLESLLYAKNILGSCEDDATDEESGR